ncbi:MULTISPECIES: DNA integrity scanning diadenylate cyclase DisA [Cetobacterium]|jgi:diadenylate cyclase|uniref:DNA integrity scanning diadenylate cyclase DisA n=1 Tax=Candidatus Cetobacterium colombiensis TaxID=3073100 RepID=A0ABU4WAW8_9FUSO|nr:DNA integrity scanning diadenylate cyclase DisA [Candidatus Cetobacterium colombiensis]MDX8336661.1 DNA integrity scanning diadenylate cyclase DisA [Candidatus Cetobacterium colombiensis]
MNNPEFLEILSLLAPGTRLREGIHNVLDGEMGALIVVGLDSEVQKIMDGGFEINCEYTPEKLFELCKMDGAIILDSDITRIHYANVHLQPSMRFATNESGTRHRTAQRVAKQTDKLVIAVSERKKVVTIYKGEMKHRLRNTPDLMGEASQGLNTLERYRFVLDRALGNLTILELDDLVTLYEVTVVLQRFEKVTRIFQEMNTYMTELGIDGRLVKLHLNDLIQDIESEKEDFLRDYWNYSNAPFDMDEITDRLSKLTDDDLKELEKLSAVLDYGKTYSTLGNRVSPKGYRILDKITKLTKRDIEKIVNTYGNLSKIQEASIEELLEIKGISKFKIKAIQTGLKRLKVTVELEK